MLISTVPKVNLLFSWAAGENEQGATHSINERGLFHISIERAANIKDWPEIVQNVSTESTFADGKLRILFDSVLSGEVSASQIVTLKVPVVVSPFHEFQMLTIASFSFLLSF